MLNQSNNFYLLSFSVLVTCLLDDVCILEGKVTSRYFPGVKELSYQWPFVIP